MIDKTIKSVMKKKINDWANSVDDKDIKNIILTKSIITGGAIVSLFNNEPPKDYDVYFQDMDSLRKVVDYYIDKFNKRHGDIENKIGYRTQAFVLDGRYDIQKQIKNSPEGWDWGSYMLKNIDENRIKIIVRSDGVASENDDHLKEPFEDVYDTLDNRDNFTGYDEAVEKIDEVPIEKIEKTDEGKEPYRPIFLSSNAITLSNKIQIVVRFHGSPEEIHSNYDFLHCTAYYLPENNSLHYTPECLRSIMEKNLIYQGSKYPVCSIIRTRKFIKRGWHINAGQYLKMCFQVSQLDLTDLNVLEDQLVGVDSAYFFMLIEALQKKVEDDKEFEITTEYVTSIIDRIFSF